MIRLPRKRFHFAHAPFLSNELTHVVGMAPLLDYAIYVASLFPTADDSGRFSSVSERDRDKLLARRSPREIWKLSSGTNLAENAYYHSFLFEVASFIGRPGSICHSRKNHLKNNLRGNQIPTKSQPKERTLPSSVAQMVQYDWIVYA